MSKSEPAPQRACRCCGGPIPASKRRGTAYCSTECANKQWREDNREKKNAYDEKWRREKHNSYIRKWREELRNEVQSGSPKGILAQKRKMLAGAKQRAKRGGYPCTLTLDDFHIPEVCPVLGIEITLGGENGRPVDSSPSLDKIVPSLGYVPGNCIVTSNRANTLKSNATIPEMEALYRFYSRKISTDWMKSHD